MSRNAAAIARRFLQEDSSTRSKSSSHTHRAALSSSFVGMRRAVLYLTPNLPTGWEKGWRPLRAGSTYGLRIRCPKCGDTPPSEMKYGYLRWRWMAVHSAGCRGKVIDIEPRRK